MGPTTEYRAAVAEALAGRSVAGSATSGGLPRDAVRNVLKGHDPKLARADAICRALGFTFTVGAPARSRPPGRHPSGPLDEARLVDLQARLTDLWDSCDAAERRHLAASVAAILDLVGAARASAPEAAPLKPD